MSHCFVSVSTDVEEVTKMVTDIDQELCRIEIDEASGAMDGSLELSPLVGLRRSIQSHNIDLSSDVSQLEFNISTLSAPDVSLMPSPEVSLVGNRGVVCQICQVSVSSTNDDQWLLHAWYRCYVP